MHGKPNAPFSAEVTVLVATEPTVAFNQSLQDLMRVARTTALLLFFAVFAE
jgi:hypothetical protein